MKIFLTAITLASLIFLAACGSALPKKDSVAAQTGILAVPKSMRSEVTFQSGWAREIEIRNNNDQVVDELMLHTVSGRQFAFSTDLSAGLYKVTAMRFVPVGESAHGGASAMRKIGDGIPFRIRKNEVTVLPVVFHLSLESTGVDSGTSRQKFLPLEDEELEKFKAVMAKANKNSEWEINWP